MAALGPCASRLTGRPCVSAVRTVKHSTRLWSHVSWEAPSLSKGGARWEGDAVMSVGRRLGSVSNGANATSVYSLRLQHRSIPTRHLFPSVSDCVASAEILTTKSEQGRWLVCLILLFEMKLLYFGQSFLFTVREVLVIFYSVPCANGQQRF